jgi:peptidyl-dipeptidase Dcp
MNSLSFRSRAASAPHNAPLSYLALSIALGLSACATNTMDVKTDTKMATTPATEPAAPAVRVNPLFSASTLPLMAPPFNVIEDADYQAAIEAGMVKHRAEIKAIAENTDAATFENTIVAIERSGLDLTRAAKVFYNLTSSTSNDALRAADEALAPKMAEHQDAISLNSQLFARIQAVYDAKTSLSGEDLRLTEVYYRQFVRAGAKLSDSDKVTLSAFNKEMASLSTRFSQFLQKDTNESAVVIDDVKQLDGLSEGDIAGAKAAAEERKLTGKYLLTLSNFTLQPQLASLKNRDVRKRLFNASINRGNNGNAFDTKATILRIAQLRAERSELLGFKTFADFSLDDQMAKTPAAVNKIMMDTAKPTLARAKEEAADIQAAIKADGQSFTLEPWDWAYYAEKVRSKKYGLDESAIRPYFELERVLQNGLFYTMHELYGITMKERKDLPLYHPDVRTFDVMDADGSQIGVIYLDYFARDSKRGGAWMDSFVDQSFLLGQKPVVLNCMNIKKAAAGEPTLLSYDEVSTMFHEFGHAVHGLFSKVKYPQLSGTNTPRDFVEFPSQFEEDWSLDPKVLANYAKHYQTGAAMPQALVDKIRKAATFNKGFEGLEALKAQMLDQDWHTMTAAQTKLVTDPVAFEAKSMKTRGVDFAAVYPRYRTTYFGHVWPGGYAAGYYAYLWTEVLAADSFYYMGTQGGLTRANGDKFREAILSKGGTAEPMALYKAYRGQEPTVDGLLIRRGLK